MRTGLEKRERGSWISVGLAAFLLTGCIVAGRLLTLSGTDLHLGSAFPLAGHYALHLGPWLLLPIAFGITAVRVAPEIAARMSWARLLVLSFVAAAGWATALGLVAGPSGLAIALTERGEYVGEVARIDAMGIGSYLDMFTDFIVGEPRWATHTAGHPPLATLAFVLLARAGLDGAGWASAVCIAGGAAAAPAVLSTLRQLAGEELGRRAAPYIVLAPAAIWIATSADALFAGVAAVAISVLAHAAVRGRTSPLGPYASSLLGGLLLGACLMMSYGLVLLAPIAAVVVLVGGGVNGRTVRLLLTAAAGSAIVVAAFAVAGFWWYDGYRETVQRVMVGAWQDRPTAYFVLANVAAAAVAVGPAVIAVLPQALQLRRQWSRFLAPAAAALAAVGVAIASNLAKGEVERIYLPFVIWLLPLAALLPGGSRRFWLAAQVGWALLVATTTTLHW